MDHVVADNININKNENNDAIENEQKFDNKFSLSIWNKEPVPVVTVSLREGKKLRTAMIPVVLFLWGSRATYIIIRLKHTKHYECRMRSNKVEHSTAAGPYCTTHDFKV